MKTLVASLLLFAAPLGTLGAGAAERFACDLHALSKDERARHGELGKALLAAVAERRELPDGYGVRLPPSALRDAAEWVSYERRCCPFFAFALEQPPGSGPVTLRITGPDGVKPFIRAEFGW